MPAVTLVSWDNVLWYAVVAISGIATPITICVPTYNNTDAFVLAYIRNIVMDIIANQAQDSTDQGNSTMTARIGSPLDFTQAAAEPMVPAND